ncbi:MAG: hypothetical protein JWQ23_3910 [Herminiimonas sp.]|nr:hypothetical protein [Herminiimonas sp.]
MSSAATTRFSQAFLLPAYATNVGSAARSLAVALLTVPSRPAARAAKVRARTGVAIDRTAGLMDLYRMAGRSDSVNPELGAQLRILASHG